MVMPSAGPGRGSIETLYVDLAARADQLVEQAEEAVSLAVRHLDRLDERAKETESTWKRVGGFIKQAFTVATGIGLANISMRVTQSIIGLGRSLISTNAQMQMFTRSFETLTGSAEEAGEIIEWVKEQAKATPFDVPGLISASQMLMTWGLDLKEWFTVVGDVAAGMNRPLSQVVNAVGTLASGQTGEAVRRFRDLGINLREFTDQLQFDARGMMITPLEEVVPIVRQIMVDKFGGMMESQSKTWQGVMSNMRDTWDQFVQVLGEPVFNQLNASLFEIFTWVEENQDAIGNFARDLGTALGSALEMLMGILDGFGRLIGYVNELGEMIAGPDWVEKGTKAAGQIAGIGAGAGRGAIDFWGGILAGEDVEEAAEGARIAWGETMLSIGGDSQDAAAMVEGATETMAVGIDAVREKWASIFEGIEDETIRRKIAEGQAALASEETMAMLEKTGIVLEGSTQAFRDQNLAVMRMAEVYNKATESSESLAKAQAAVAEQMAKVRAEQQANLDLASQVAAKLGDRLRQSMEDYLETVEKIKAKTADAIAEIEAKAATAETTALQRANAEMEKLREDYAREQIRRRRNFNVEWARLIREQNQEVLDAEWEYQFRKEQLLIEGDEIQLAELEARYKHEKSTRSREHTDARDDLQLRFAMEEQQRAESFRLQMAELESRLEREIDAIREEAREEVEAKKAALEEKLAHEENALQERLQKLGEMLAQEVADNEYAAAIVLQAWEFMYGEQVRLALETGMAVRAELDATVNAALLAAAEIANVYAGYRSGQRGRGAYWRRGQQPRRYQAGGYTPDTVAPITTDPGEWIATAGTTSMLEQAVGGPLTQLNIQRLATSRRMLDVRIDASGLPADVVEKIYDDLIDAMTQETGVE